MLSSSPTHYICMTQMHTTIVSDSAKTGLTAFQNSEIWWITYPQVSSYHLHITPINSCMFWDILGPCFKNSQLNLWVSKYVLLGSAIRPLFAELFTFINSLFPITRPHTNQFNMHKYLT